MKTKFIAQLAGMALFALASTAYSATISLVAVQTDVAPGDDVNIEFWADFSDDPTLGGGTDIFYDDNLLDFVSWAPTVDAAVFDPGFAMDPTDLGGELDGLAFGNFNGISGPVLVGVLNFVAADGASRAPAIFGAGVTDGAAGPFVSATTFQIQNVTFDTSQATVEVAASAIPVPAALWLMIGGIGALLGFRRKA